MTRPPRHPAGHHHHQAAACHQAAAHHHHQAAYHYDLGEFEDADKHATAARDYASLAIDLTATAYDRFHGRLLQVIEH